MEDYDNDILALPEGSHFWRLESGKNEFCKVASQPYGVNTPTGIGMAVLIKSYLDGEPRVWEYVRPDSFNVKLDASTTPFKSVYENGVELPWPGFNEHRDQMFTFHACTVKRDDGSAEHFCNADKDTLVRQVVSSMYNEMEYPGPLSLLLDDFTYSLIGLLENYAGLNDNAIDFIVFY